MSEVKSQAPVEQAAPKPEATQTPEVKQQAAPPAETKPIESDSKPAVEVKPDEQTPSEELNVVPEKYDLKLPENSALDPSYIEELSAWAKEMKLSNEDAQSILERDSGLAQKGVDALTLKAQEQSQKWAAEAKLDKDIGGAKFEESVNKSHEALRTLFPNTDFKEFLDKTGLGNNPAVIKGFVQIWQMLNPNKIYTQTNQPPARPTRESRIYDHPTSPKN